MPGQVTFLYDNAVVWITGGSSGIGRAIAKAFGDAGARVAITARHPEPLQETANEFAESGIEALALVGDVRDPARVEQTAAEIIDRWGTVDILINNAGGNFAARLEDTSINGWRAVVDANLTSAFLCAKACFPHFRRQQRGTIVNIGSSAAFGAHPLRASYGAAKAGLSALTKSMAHEWAPYNIRINCIAPGAILTPTSRWNQADDQADVLGRTPLERLGRPEEVADLCLFIASDHAAYMTGTTIVLDGGPRLAV